MEQRPGIDRGETRAVLLFDFARPGMEHPPLDEPPPEVREMVIRSRG